MPCSWRERLDWTCLSQRRLRTFEYVKNLGASKVFGYNQEDVIAQIMTELENGKPCMGIFQAAGTDSAIEPCLEVSKRSKNDIFVATTSPVQEEMIPEGVRAKMIFGDGDASTWKIWADFLPRASRGSRVPCCTRAVDYERQRCCRNSGGVLCTEEGSFCQEGCCFGGVI